MTMTTIPPILNAQQVAELLQCSVRTVEDRARTGDLPGEKFGEGWVFPAEALLERVNEIARERAKERRKHPVGTVVTVIPPSPTKSRRRPPVDLTKYVTLLAPSGSPSHNSSGRGSVKAASAVVPGGAGAQGRDDHLAD